MAGPSLSTGRLSPLANSPELSLYIHLPFCSRRCSYCDFFSVAGASPILMQRVLDKILGDIARGLAKYAPSHIDTAYIGGGTPSLIPSDRLQGFLSVLKELIGDVDEITIEANPESLSLEFLQILGLNGINRLSMGAQSYDDRLLNWLGRPGNLETLQKADEIIRKHWKGKLNRDILTGLPRKNRSLTWDIKQAAEDNPGHISIYELTIERGTPLALDSHRLSELPSSQARLHEWFSVLDFLREKGYGRYEVSNFAKPGQECLHNMRYWQLRPYLGIGPGSSSTIWDNSGALRMKEPEDIIRWLDGSQEGVIKEFLSVRDFMLEHFIMGLRTKYGLSRPHFKAIFGRDPLEVIHRTAERLYASNMLQDDETYLRLSMKGMDVLNPILREVLDEIDNREIPNTYSWPQP